MPNQLKNIFNTPLFANHFVKYNDDFEVIFSVVISDAEHLDEELADGDKPLFHATFSKQGKRIDVTSENFTSEETKLLSAYIDDAYGDKHLVSDLLQFTKDMTEVKGYSLRMSEQYGQVIFGADIEEIVFADGDYIIF